METIAECERGHEREKQSGKNILSPHINNDNNDVIRFGAVAAFEKAFMDFFLKNKLLLKFPSKVQFRWRRRTFKWLICELKYFTTLKRNFSMLTQGMEIYLF